MAQYSVYLLSTKTISKYAIGLSCLLSMLTTMSFADEANIDVKQPKVAVVYPQVRAPFDRVFKEIVGGIREQVSPGVELLKVDKSDKEQNLGQWLQTVQPSRVIALGVSGLKATAALNMDTPVVVGAVTSPQSIPASFSRILLTPDPVILFEKLKTLTPHINEVSVIFHPQQKDWLIHAAKIAADNAGYSLNVFEAETLQQAAERYQQILPQLSANCAIWIVYGRLDRAVFAEILDVAWSRKLVVFSNNFSHVKKGVLFSLYPDNKALGRSLGKIAMGDGKKQQRYFLNDVYTAVNLRTAGHLGLTFNKTRDYDLAFPPK